MNVHPAYTCAYIRVRNPNRHTLSTTLVPKADASDADRARNVERWRSRVRHWSCWTTWVCAGWGGRKPRSQNDMNWVIYLFISCPGTMLFTLKCWIDRCFTWSHGYWPIPILVRGQRLPRCSLKLMWVKACSEDSATPPWTGGCFWNHQGMHRIQCSQLGMLHPLPGA